MKNNTVLGIIDMQRGFMPATEGKRLGVPGFGELPVSGGEKLVPTVNKLMARFAMKNLFIFTTQDWHPPRTAHFAEEPDFMTTWPVHCIGGTPGSELHTEIIVPNGTIRIRKGMEVLERGEDDTSYSGYNGMDDKGEPLGEILGRIGAKMVVLGGLALDYCVGATALDLRRESGLDVIVAIDATQAITDDTGQAMMRKFEENDIRMITTDAAIRQIDMT